MGKAKYDGIKDRYCNGARGAMGTSGVENWVREIGVLWQDALFVYFQVQFLKNHVQGLTMCDQSNGIPTFLRIKLYPRTELDDAVRH